MINNRATRALPDDAKRLLTELWRCQLSADTRAQTPQELRECIRRVSASARAAGLLPEDLIIGVKRSWEAHHEARATSPFGGPQWALSNVVSMCINEYYAAPNDRRARNRVTP